MKRILSLALAAGLALALGGCGSSSKFTAGSNSISSAPMYYNESAMAEDFAMGSGYDSASAEIIAPANRKIIYHASLTLETKDYAATCAALRQAAAEAGGYLESTNEYGSAEYGNRSASFCFRIPSARYQEFLGKADETGSVTRRSESTEDITSQYVDVEARLSSLEAQKAKLEELRAQAEDLDDLLTIEGRISDVQYQLESYTRQRRMYDNQVDYCTVNISVNEVAIYTPVNTFGSRISAAMDDTLDGFVEFLQDIVIFFIYALPYLLLLAVIVAVIGLLRRKLPKRAPRQPKGKKSIAPGADYGPLYGAAKNEPEENSDSK